MSMKCEIKRRRAIKVCNGGQCFLPFADFVGMSKVGLRDRITNRHADQIDGEDDCNLLLGDGSLAIF